MKALRNRYRMAFQTILVLIFSICVNPGIFAQIESETTEQSEIDYKKQAPDFSLYNLNGQNVQLQDYKDKILVLHIATTWCPFCNAEAPHLEKLYQEYKTRGVEVLIIDVKEPKELVEQQLKNKHDLSFPILLDTDGKVAASFAPENILPELSRDEVMLASNLIIDQQGTIRYMSLLDSKNFDAELKTLKEKLNELL